MARIAFICPYFGRLPEHIEFWLKTISHNLDHHFFLITDDFKELDFPQNVTVSYMNFSDFKDKCQEKFGFKISLDTIRKLGDYKPAFGYIFEDLIDGFDAWGHIDVADEWYGQINNFITDEIISDYEKIMLLGHMTIYRNTHEANRRFMMKCNEGFTYEEVYSSNHFFNFEELNKGSINQIFIDNNIPVKQLNECIADITDKTYEFHRAHYYDVEKKEYCSFNENIPIYSWENGRIFGYELKEDRISKKEMLYIHIKRRKLSVDVDVSAEKFLIVPNCFIPFEEVTVSMLESYSKRIADNTKKRKRIYNSIKYHIGNVLFSIRMRVFGIKVDYIE